MFMGRTSVGAALLPCPPLPHSDQLWSILHSWSTAALEPSPRGLLASSWEEECCELFWDFSGREGTGLTPRVSSMSRDYRGAEGWGWRRCPKGRDGPSTTQGGISLFSGSSQGCATSGPRTDLGSLQRRQHLRAAWKQAWGSPGHLGTGLTLARCQLPGIPDTRNPPAGRYVCVGVRGSAGTVYIS